MSTEKNYYDILGISESDRKKQGKEFDKILKKAFRSMAVKYHPDKWVNGSEQEKADAEAKFKEANEAHDILSDPEKRKMYDTYGTVNPRQNTGGNDVDDMMRNFARRHGFNIDDNFGPTARKRMVVGSDVNARVKVSVKDIINGATKKFRYRKMSPCSSCNGTGNKNGSEPQQCPHCNGRGMYTKTTRYGNSIYQETSTCPYCGGAGIVITDPCPQCSGSGLQETKDEETVTIPKGVTNNAYITIEGKGNHAMHCDGVPGNLNVIFTIDDSDGFNLMDDSNYDIVYNKYVSVLDFLTGTSVTVPLPEGGDVNIDIRPGEEDGQLHRIIGKGLYDSYSNRGDYFVKMHMRMPSKINSKETEIINSLKSSDNFKNLSER